MTRKTTLATLVSTALALMSITASGQPEPESRDDDPAAADAHVPVPSPLACVPGRQIECACAGGRFGSQRCLPDGSGFEPCNQCAPLAPVDLPTAPDDTVSEPTNPVEHEREGQTDLQHDEVRGSASTMTPGSRDADVGDRGSADTVSRFDDPSRSRLGVYVAGAAALDETAFAASLGGRYRIDENWLVGLDAEWNPWLSIDTTTLSPGTFNLYGTVVKRWRVRKRMHLRSSFHAGTSVLLEDLVGAPAGSTGLYLGSNLIGIEYALKPSTYLVIDPADVAFVAPKVTGAPLTYRQYRFTIGLQFGG